MRLPGRTGRASGAANMTPMIDVVFLLIIFFLVSSHLARQETRIELDLPLADASIDDAAQTDVLTINVLTSGAWQVSGTLIGNEQQLMKLMAEHNAAHGEDAPVRIRTDRSAKYSRVEPVLRAAARSGLWNASFAVYQEDR